MFHLIRKNSMGYESAWCTNGEWVGTKYCAFPKSFRMERCPTVKTWKTAAGAERWLADRPGMKEYSEVRERAA